jgi:hypothetical protein
MGIYLIYIFLTYDQTFRHAKRALNNFSLYYGHLKEQLSKTTKLFSTLEASKPMNEGVKTARRHRATTPSM